MATNTLSTSYTEMAPDSISVLQTEYWSGLIFVEKTTTVLTEEWHGVDEILNADHLETDYVLLDLGGPTVGLHTDYYHADFETTRVALGRLLQEDIAMQVGYTYRLSFVASNMSCTEGIISQVYVRQGSQIILTFDTTDSGANVVTFVADSSGNEISFWADKRMVSMTIDQVCLRERVRASTNDNRNVKEFLTGDTDEGGEIFFRVDTNYIQLGYGADNSGSNTNSKKEEFEMYSQPLRIASRVHRGSGIRCYIGLDKEEFYELEGAVNKGFSVLDVHAPQNVDLRSVMARKVRLSWRDATKQRCRLVQGAIIYLPSAIDHIE